VPGSAQVSEAQAWFYWAIAGVLLCYATSAAAAATLGLIWAAMTAVSLLLATTRGQTAGTESGPRDTSGDHEDAFPGIGMDRETPLGDTSEHSDALDDANSAESPPRDSRRARRIRQAS
jgi:hypothetical protein